MTNDHPLLTGIRTALENSGVHSLHWGDLRRGVFPETSWDGLKAWCAEHTIECELAFGQSSKDAQVQFRKLRKG